MSNLKFLLADLPTLFKFNVVIMILIFGRIKKLTLWTKPSQTSYQFELDKAGQGSQVSLIDGTSVRLPDWNDKNLSKRKRDWK